MCSNKKKELKNHFHKGMIAVLLTTQILFFCESKITTFYDFSKFQ